MLFKIVSFTIVKLFSRVQIYLPIYYTYNLRLSDESVIYVKILKELMYRFIVNKLIIEMIQLTTIHPRCI